jgi:hypothetical protein
LKKGSEANSTWYIDEKVVYTVQGMDTIISISFLILIIYLFIMKRTNSNGETYRVNVERRGWIIIMSYYLSVTLSAIIWNAYAVLKWTQSNKKES